jgi:hypothetical protein
MALILSGDTGVPASGMPTGSVIQTVNGVTTTQLQVTGTTYTDTGLTATITPTASTSKVLVLVSIPYELGSSNNNGGFFKLLRGSTSICENAYNPYMYGANWTSSAGSNYIDGVCSMNVLDSPATTSATIYKVQFKIYTTNNTLTISNYNAPCSITLLEIHG